MAAAQTPPPRAGRGGGVHSSGREGPPSPAAACEAHFTPPRPRRAATPRARGPLRPRAASASRPFRSWNARTRHLYFTAESTHELREPLGSQARRHSPGPAPPAGRGTARWEARRRPAASCPGGRRGSFGTRPGRRRLCPLPGKGGGAARPSGRRGGSPARAAPRSGRRPQGSGPFSVGAAMSLAAFWNWASSRAPTVPSRASEAEDPTRSNRWRFPRAAAPPRRSPALAASLGACALRRSRDPTPGCVPLRRRAREGPGLRRAPRWRSGWVLGCSRVAGC